MPNWCENRLRILGDEKDVQDFVKKAGSKGTALSFNNFVPMPKELDGTTSPPVIVKEAEYEQAVKKVKEENKESRFPLALPITEKIRKNLTEKYGTDNWYDWSIKNWGTKWDVKTELASEGVDDAEYTFDTAWSPPIAWLEKVSSLYPRIQFILKYEEGGMGFMGVAKAKNGKVDDQYIEY